MEARGKGRVLPPQDRSRLRVTAPRASASAQPQNSAVASRVGGSVTVLGSERDSEGDSKRDSERAVNKQ